VNSDVFVPVGAAADIAPGKSAVVLVDSTEIAVFNAGGTFYALDNTCPHQGASLSEGLVKGTTVTCPWHSWCFNLTDGSMTVGAWASVETYDVKVEDGQIAVSRAPRPRPPRT